MDRRKARARASPAHLGSSRHVPEHTRERRHSKLAGESRSRAPSSRERRHAKLTGESREGERGVRRGSRAGRKDEQLALPFPRRRGGARLGAGRKRVGARACVPHRGRPVQRATEPVHVTLRARIAPLRSQFVFPTVRLALSRAARRDPERFRIVHFSVQRDHVHLVVEAANKRALSSGVRSVAIRVALYVNELLSRRGPLWADRWHGRALTSPREVRAAVVYVLANFRKHARRAVRSGIDPYSSAVWFDGFREWHPDSGVPPPFAEHARFGARVIAGTSSSTSCAGEQLGDGRDFAARTWLATTGWRKRGLLGLSEAPAS